MSFALELFLTAAGMIFGIVMIAEVIWKTWTHLEKRD
jgi:hypothetical protein